MDPPRTGLSFPVLETLAERKPPLLLYVSCLPQSLARDLAELGAAIGLLAGLLWRPAGPMAGMSLAVLLLAAVVTHLRAGDSLRQLVPAVLILALDALYLGSTVIS